MQKNFNELFNSENGLVSAKVTIKIGNIVLMPHVGALGSIPYIDLSKYIDKKIEVEVEDGIYLIIGNY